MPKLPGYMQIIVYHNQGIYCEIAHTRLASLSWVYSPILPRVLCSNMQSIRHSYPLSSQLSPLGYIRHSTHRKIFLLCRVVVCFNMHILRSFVSFCSFLPSLLLRQMKIEGSTEDASHDTLISTSRCTPHTILLPLLHIQLSENPPTILQCTGTLQGMGQREKECQLGCILTVRAFPQISKEASRRNSKQPSKQPKGEKERCICPEIHRSAKQVFSPSKCRINLLI